MAEDGAMPQEMVPSSHLFSSKNSYLFIWDGIPGSPDPIVESFTQILNNEMLFIFKLGYKTESTWVKKENILAVKDNQNGLIEIKGWSGKYVILNRELFEKYLKEGVVKLKDEQTFPIKIDSSMPDCDIYFNGSHFYSQGK